MDFLFHILIEPWIAILTAPLFFGEVVIGGILSGVMYALVALGFVLIYKASGVFNFAQGVMVLFAALSLVGLMERGAPLLLAIVLTGLIMLALAFAIERVILRYMVNQEQIILFMATIGLTFFLEGFGETLWGSNVKALDIGIPDAPLNVAKVAIATPLLAAVFVAAVVASLAILVIWRTRAARRAIDELGSSAVSVLCNTRYIWCCQGSFGLPSRPVGQSAAFVSPRDARGGMTKPS
jgi:branched-chain amino acid transport system permease protein